MTHNHASHAVRQDHRRGSFRTGFRNAHQKSTPMIAYSLRWQPLRNRKTMWSTCSAVRLGASQCSSGARMREECWEDAASLEPTKITAIQKIAGDQYFKNTRPFNTAHRKPGMPAGSNLKRAIDASVRG